MSLEATLYGAFLGLSLAIGALASWRVRGLKDYYVAGAQMPWYLLCGTFIASNVSAGVFLGGTNMNARHGYTMWCSYFTTSIGYLLAIGVIGVLVKRLASRYEIYDFADIFAVRYPTRRGAIRVLIAIVLPLIYVPTLAAQFIALAAISGSMFTTSYEFLLVFVVAVVVLYTVMGGMLGVVWNDTFQFFVLIIGLIVAVPVGMGLLGHGDATAGWSVLIADSPELFKWRTDDWRWYDVLGQFVWIFAVCAQPHLITRFLTARDERTILKALPVCIVGALVIYASTVPVGLLGRVSLEAIGGRGARLHRARQTYPGSLGGHLRANRYRCGGAVHLFDHPYGDGPGLVPRRLSALAAGRQRCAHAAGVKIVRIGDRTVRRDTRLLPPAQHLLAGCPVGNAVRCDFLRSAARLLLLPAGHRPRCARSNDRRRPGGSHRLRGQQDDRFTLVYQRTVRRFVVQLAGLDVVQLPQ